jgi:alkylation response protein AidB-like acyl-CoA dehydrogenase
MSSFETFREQARAWLQENAPEFGRDARRGLSPEADLALARRYMRAKHDAGYVGIAWPKEVGGQGRGHVEKILFEVEEAAFGMPVSYFGVSLGMPIPVLIRFGEDREWVRERTVAALRGEEIWCQLFSEPSGGSDLAGLRTRVERDRDGWKLNGQKLWISWAQHSDYGVIVARTDPTVAKHKGLTYFWIDMHASGVTVRPFKLADGGSHVNEVYFDDVHVSDSQRIGPVGGGFGVALATLMIERYAATDSAGFGPHLDLFIEVARAAEIGGKPALADGRVRQAIARNYAMRAGLQSITARAMQVLQAGNEPGPQGSLNKLIAVRSRQRLSELAIDLQGNAGLAWERGASVKEDWTASWLNAATGRIAGGADEMLLNTIAEKVLGLPQDHRPDKGVPFNQIPA